MPDLACLVDTSATPAIQVVPIVLYRGDDVVVRITFRSSVTRELIDWTGWAFTSKAKASIGGALWTTGACTHDGVGGTVTIAFPKAETVLLTPDLEGVWDLQGTDPGALVRTVARGSALVVGDVT